MYSELRLVNCHVMWVKLRGSKIILDPPWFVVTDFNEALSGFEHFLVNPRREAQMVAFHGTLEMCEFVDSVFSDALCTYDNMRRGTTNVRVCLDRTIAEEVTYYRQGQGPIIWGPPRAPHDH